MTQQIFTQSSNAAAFITKGKQRIKQLNGNVHLNDGESFEIELFNPNSTNILAEISINDSKISGGGIVVRPGERVFLERFLDTNKKFVFKTYTVDGNNKQAKKAIESNGNVTIEFYQEKTTNITYASGWTYTDTSGGYQSSITSFRSHPYTLTGGNLTNTTGNVLYDANVSFTGNCCNTITFDDSTIETGRIGKGAQSNQKLTTVDMDFESYSFKTIEWKILPISQLKLTSKDIKHHCVSCGTRIKKTSYKYCPTCGTKVD